MKKYYIYAIAFSLAMLCTVTNASALVINDGYVGGEHILTGDGVYHSVRSIDDIYGTAANYDVDRAEVSMDGDILVVDIYSQYLDNIDRDGTQLGDLFISTNGWHPVGSGADGYITDYFDRSGQGNEEIWEYALVLDDHFGTSGDAGLYALTDSSGDYATGVEANIKTAEYFHSSQIRTNQEVQYFGTGNALGDWGISYGAVDTDDFLRFEIDSQYLANFDINNLGIHWTMSCANDVLEGGTNPVPEPMTLVLFGSGLACLAGNSMRRKK